MRQVISRRCGPQNDASLAGIAQPPSNTAGPAAGASSAPLHDKTFQGGSVWLARSVWLAEKVDKASRMWPYRSDLGILIGREPDWSTRDLILRVVRDPSGKQDSNQICKPTVKRRSYFHGFQQGQPITTQRANSRQHLATAVCQQARSWRSCGHSSLIGLACFGPDRQTCTPGRKKTHFPNSTVRRIQLFFPAPWRT